MSLTIYKVSISSYNSFNDIDCIDDIPEINLFANFEDAMRYYESISIVYVGEFIELFVIDINSDGISNENVISSYQYNYFCTDLNFNNYAESEYENRQLNELRDRLLSQCGRIEELRRQYLNRI